ncbi:MAG: phasin family protein [Geminicoccaceae bacterium]
MAQTARSETAKADDQAKERSRESTDQLARIGQESGRVAKEMTEDAAEAGGKIFDTTRKEAARAADATSKAAKDVTSRSAETLRQSTATAGKAAGEALNGQSELMRALVEIASEQFRHNLETARRFAAVRDWTEASELQHQYVVDSLDRFSAGMKRCFALTRDLMGKMIETGTEQSRPH